MRLRKYVVTKENLSEICGLINKFCRYDENKKDLFQYTTKNWKTIETSGRWYFEKPKMSIMNDCIKMEYPMRHTIEPCDIIHMDGMRLVIRHLYPQHDGSTYTYYLVFEKCKAKFEYDSEE